MGRYIKQTGIDATVDLCDAMEPVVIGPLLSMMGFPNNSCPPAIVSTLSFTEQKTWFIYVESNTNAFIYSVGLLPRGRISNTKRRVSRHVRRE